MPHPEHDDYAQFPVAYDTGVVLLVEPSYAANYAQLPPLGPFDYLLTSRGPPSERQAVVVGDGLQGRIPAFAGDDRERHRAVSMRST